MLIHLKHIRKYECSFYNHYEIKETNYVFKNVDGNNTFVKVNLDERTIEATCKKEISQDLFDALSEGIYQGKCIFSQKWVPDESVDKKIVENYYNDLLIMQFDVINSVEKTYKLIKYLLNQYKWNLSGGGWNHWSLDEINWERIPEVHWGRMAGPNIPFTDENSKKIQQCIDDGFEPFVALDFLYKARHEGDPKFRWIYTTIAAELAIKEFLIRKDKKLETILIELPSPPLHILYGKILKEIGEVNSCFTQDDIHNAVKVRNWLVHRPMDVEINSQDADEYIHLVATTIFQLLSNLNPQNQLISEYRCPPKVKIPKLRKIELKNLTSKPLSSKTGYFGL